MHSKNREQWEEPVKNCGFFNKSVAENPQEYSEPSGTSTIEPFCENSQQLLAVKYFCKKVPS